jgi:hypothetical protein
MSDRPTPVNGKRNQAWGTTSACPQCGACLCFSCHPHGPCVDEHESAQAASERSACDPEDRFRVAAGNA